MTKRHLERERARKRERERAKSSLSKTNARKFHRKVAILHRFWADYFGKKSLVIPSLLFFFLYSSQLSVSTADIDFQESSVERPQTF